MIRMIVGLGNPGKSYAANRHNAGFIFIDQLTHSFSSVLEVNKKLKSEFGDAELSNAGLLCKLRLVKPLTYMNLSGQAVVAHMSALKLKPEQILVVYDEVELELGRVRFKLGGGSAGHNGVRSIDQAIGREYFRLKIGISSLERHNYSELSNYVLGNFTHSQIAHLHLVCRHLRECIDEIINKTFRQDRFVQFD